MNQENQCSLRGCMHGLKSLVRIKKEDLNEKGRKSYEAENPGSDLKAPSKKKGNKRRRASSVRE